MDEHKEEATTQKRTFFSVLSKGVKNIAVFFFFTGLFLGVAGVCAFLYLYISVAPDVKYLDRGNISQTTTIYDRTGQHVLYEIFGEQNRKILSHDDIPESVRLATLAAEDDDFYHHYGIDFLAMARAFWINFRQEGIAQGGSTITMQLARNVFLNRERTFERKVAEVVLAIKIENRFTKDEILDWYLNIIPYGSNAYGIETAAQTFFGKSAKNLTLDEAALLAALPKATTDYSPYSGNTKRLEARQRNILERMRSIGLIGPESLDEAVKADTLSKIRPISRNIVAPHFVFYVLEELEKVFGRDILEVGGLKVFTTLDLDMQDLAQRKVIEGVERNKPYRASNAAMVAIDPKTGDILAMVGSKDYYDRTIGGQVNVAVRPRQPGSSFKPLVYARAFEMGFQPETMLYDAPTNFGPDGSGRDYVPSNYDGSFHGIVSMRDSLANSLNIPAVKTLYLVGIDQMIDFAKRLGIESFDDRGRFGLSMALGGAEVTLLEETAAFSVFANDGLRHSASGILRVTGSDDREIPGYERITDQAVSNDVARKINSVLSDDAARSMVFGTGTPLSIRGTVVAAKSGTTQNFHDGWTVGYTPSLAVGVWVGNNDNTALAPGSDGIRVAAPLWNDFMREALGRYSPETFPTYEKAQSAYPMVAGDYKRKVKYYNAKTGKEISESKARKKDAEDVRVKMDPDTHDLLFYLHYVPGDGSLPKYDLDMVNRWERGVGKTGWDDED